MKKIAGRSDCKRCFQSIHILLLEKWMHALVSTKSIYSKNLATYQIENISYPKKEQDA